METQDLTPLRELLRAAGPGPGTDGLDPAGDRPPRPREERTGAASEDRRLAEGLRALYPDTDLEPAPEAGWAALAPEAQRLAGRQRRRYLLRELAAGLFPQAALRRAAAAVLLGALLLARGTAVPPPVPAERLTAARAALATAPRGGAPRDLLLLDGAEVRLEGGRMDVEQGDPGRTRLLLHAGTVRLSVPRLRGPRRLAVATRDAEVIVHGTRFDVSKLTAATQIAVHEGLVEVRPQGGGRPPVFLRPGEQILVPGLESYRADLGRRVAALVQELRCEDPERVLDAYLASAPDQDVSAALYLKGVCAAGRGAMEEAILAFERAAAVSADPLRADNALARAAQLRAVRDPAAGAQAWRRYLQRFPGGLHHELARRHGAPPSGR